jgi:hypothetical protein
MSSSASYGHIKAIHGLLLKISANGQSHLALQGEEISADDTLTLLSGNAFIQMGDNPLTKLSDYTSIPVKSSEKSEVPAGKLKEHQLIEEGLNEGKDIGDILASLDDPTAGEALPQSGGANFFIQQPSYSLGAVSAGYETSNFEQSTTTFGSKTLLYQPNSESSESSFASVSSTTVGQVTSAILPPTVQMHSNDLISLSRSGLDSSPYGSSEVAEYLLNQSRDGKAVNSVPINGVDLSNIAMRVESDITVSFIREGAGYQNIIGYYLFDPSTGEILTGKENSGLLWINSSQSGNNLISQPFGANTLKQSVSYTIESVPEGVAVGFFLIGDGFNYLSNNEKNSLKTYEDMYELNEHIELSINNGTALVTFNDGDNFVVFEGRGLYFTHDDSLSSDGITHSLSGVSFNNNIAETLRGKLIVGFEDLLNGGDNDYEDIIFSVDFNNDLASFVGDSRPIVRAINVADNAMIASLTLIASNLLENDVINFKESNNTLTVLGSQGELTVVYDDINYQFDYELSIDGNAITYTFLAQGESEATFAPAGAYELLAQSLIFKPSTESGTDGVRIFSGYVVDENGLQSDFDHVNYMVEVEETLQIDIAESAGILDFNAGNDMLLISNEDVELDDQSQFSGGTGLDTIKLDGYGNMSFDAQFFKDHFAGGWEKIDMTGEGNQAINSITLDAEAVFSLIDESENTLTITVDDNEVPVLQIVGDEFDKVTLKNAAEISNSGNAGKLYEFSSDPGVYVQVISASGPTGDLPIIETPIA